MSWDMRSPGLVRTAVTDVLREWLCPAVREVASDDGGDPDTVDVPHPVRGYRHPADIDDLFRGEIPLVGVAILNGTPLRNHPTTVDVRWQVEVRCWVRGRDYERTAELAGWYGTAVAAVLDQQQPLDGCQVQSVAFDAVAADTNGRVVGEVRVGLTVWQCATWDTADAPDEAPDCTTPYTPQPDSPVVLTTTTTVTPETEE